MQASEYIKSENAKKIVFSGSTAIDIGNWALQSLIAVQLVCMIEFDVHLKIGI